MSQTPPTPVTAAPAQPVRGNRATFSGLVDAFVTWLIAAVTQFNNLGTNAYNNAVDAFNNATAAASSASAAAIAANAAAVTTGVTIWVSGTTYAIGDCRFSPINSWTYRRRTTGAGTTDPSLDTTNWALISATVPPLILLATLTPTAAANVDFLTTFSATYDNYLILIDGVKPAADDSLLMRLANAGTSDTGSNYALAPVGSNSTTTYTTITLTSTVTAAGKGMCGEVLVLNANDATNGKAVRATSASQSASAPSWIAVNYMYFYFNAAAVSGARLYWTGGSNFAATGKIRVYGYNNS